MNMKPYTFNRDISNLYLYIFIVLAVKCYLGIRQGFCEIHLVIKHGGTQIEKRQSVGLIMRRI